MIGLLKVSLADFDDVFQVFLDLVEKLSSDAAFTRE